MKVKLLVAMLITVIFSGCNTYVGRAGECIKGNVIVREYKASFIDDNRTLFEDRYITKEYVLTNKQNEVIKCERN